MHYYYWLYVSWLNIIVTFAGWSCSEQHVGERSMAMVWFFFWLLEILMPNWWIFATNGTANIPFISMFFALVKINQRFLNFLLKYLQNNISFVWWHLVDSSNRFINTIMFFLFCKNSKMGQRPFECF